MEGKESLDKTDARLKSSMRIKFSLRRYLDLFIIILYFLIAFACRLYITYA